MRVHSAWRFLLLACSLHASPPPGTKGRVLDAVTGRGIPGARVTTVAQGTNPLVSLHTITDANGDFAFAEAGGWTDCQREGYKRLLETEIVGADGSRPESFDVGGVTITTPYLILMMPLDYLPRFSNPTSIAGTVVDQANHPVSGAEVAVRQPGDDRSRNTQTDSEGRFTLKAHPGETELTVTDLPCETSRPGRASFSKLQLAAGGHHELRIVLKPGPTYPVAGLIQNHVTPYDAIMALSLFPQGQLRSDGCRPKFLKETARSFSFSGVPAGRYFVNATLSRNVHDCDTCSGEPVYTVTQPIEVSAKSGRPPKIDIYQGADVTGSIHREGKPPVYINSRPVCVVNAAGVDYCNDANDPQNPQKIHLSHVQPGEYRIVAGIKSGEFWISEGRDFYVTEARLDSKPLSSGKLIIGTDVDRATLDLYTSSTAAHCNVHVVDSEHHPLSLYSVALMKKQGIHYVVRDFDPRVAERYSFVPGQYLLLALTPALPRIAFEAGLLEQYASRATPITLSAGETLKVEVAAIEAHPLAQDPQ